MAKTSRKTRAKKSTVKRPAKSVSKAVPKPPVAAAQPANLPSIKLPNIWQLTKLASRTAWQHKQLFSTIILIYGLLNLLLVRGLASGTDVGSLKQQLDAVFNGQFGSLASGLSVFALLISSSGNGSSQTAGAYQAFLGLIVSLAVIWALRQVLAGVSIRARDAYYRGMYPLIPFILVLLVCCLQLLPLIIGTSLYSLVISNGIAVHVIEKLLWAVLTLVLMGLSLYLLSSSLFALYIVTLPDMTPLKALRSARQLVRRRRFAVLRKIISLPILLFVVAAVIMVPIIIIATSLAQWVFFILTMFGLLAVHTYLYTLYRELLNE